MQNFQNIGISRIKNDSGNSTTLQIMIQTIKIKVET